MGNSCSCTISFVHPQTQIAVPIDRTSSLPVLEIEEIKDDLKEIGVVLVGDPKVGKTSLVQKLVNNHFEKFYVPSMSVEKTRKLFYLGDEKINIKFVTVSSKLYHSESSCEDFRTAKVILFMFDISNADTFEAVKEKLLEMRSDLSEKKFMLIGNKSDLKPSKTKSDEIDQLTRDNETDYFEVSVLNNRNLFTLIKKICLEI